MKTCWESSLIVTVAIWFAQPLNTVAQSVDLLTGQAQVSIPIWELNYGDLSVPVSLYHHGSAIHVEEGEGAFGVGWNLAAGGAISRSVRGLPDDYSSTTDTREGWLFDNQAGSICNYGPTSNDDLSVCTDETVDYNFLDGQGYTKDTEPDMFYFNAPGLSGQFVFGSDGNPKLFPYQDLAITVNKDGNGKILSFSIINDRGITYLFSTVESVARKRGQSTPVTVTVFQTDFNYYQTEATFNSAWLLTSITSSATSRVANFTYNDLVEAHSTRYITLIGTGSNLPDTLYFITDRYTPRQLSSITAGYYSVNFSWYNELVRKISVTTMAGIETKDFEFYYDEVTSSTDTSNPKVHRSFLSEIKQAKNCQNFPSYAFSYEGVSGSTVSFPFETRYKQDEWGYYNGGSTNKNVPTIYYYANEQNERRFRTSPIPSLTVTQTLSGDTRTVNTATVGFGALTEINYPRGGKVKYSYEANQYYDPSDSTTRTGPGVRVKSVSSYGGEVAYGKIATDIDTAHSIQRDYQYKLPDGKPSGLLTYPPSYTLAFGAGLSRTLEQMGETPQLLYSRVKEIIPGRGSRVYEYELPGMYPYASATRSKIARTSCSAGNLKNGRYTFPFAPNPNIERGFLKRQTEFSSAGAMVSQRRLYYSTQNIAVAGISGIKFEKISNGFHFSKYDITAGTRKVLSQEVSLIVGEESPADSTKITMAYAYNSNHMLQTITTTYDDGTVKQEKFKYAKDFASISSPSGIEATALKALNQNNRHGEIIETYQTVTPSGSSTPNVTGASLVLYKTFTNPALVLPYKFLAWPQLPSGFTEATSNSTTFSYNNNHYIASRTIEEYDSKGNVAGESDRHKNQIGYWTMPNYALPSAAVIVKAKLSQAAYEGFEWAYGPGFSIIGSGVTFGEPFAGTQSLQLTSSGVYIKSVNIERSGNTYRVSCWVKAAQYTTLTFVAKNGSSNVSGSSTPVIYNPSSYNQWVYLEGKMDVTNAPSTFQVELTSNATALVDEIVSVPENARIALSSVRPLLGLTSQTDDRGNSVSYAFDVLGRKVKTFDRKQNLVEQKDYLDARSINKRPSAAFSSSTTNYATGQATTFTSALNSCIEFTYSWEIYKTGSTPVATSTNSNITHTFASGGEYNIKLTVNSTLYGSGTFVQNVCVLQTPPAYTLYVTPSQTFYKCGDLVRTFAVVHPPTGGAYQWLVRIGTSPYWDLLSETSSTLVYSSPLQNYEVKCIITKFYSGVTENPGCIPMTSTESIATATMTYVDNSPCP